MMKIKVVTWPRGRQSLMAHMLRICLGKDWSLMLDRRNIAAQAKPADLLELGLTYLVENEDFLPSVVLQFDDRVARGAEDSAAAFHQFASEEFSRYDSFRTLWAQPDLAPVQIAVEAAEMRSYPKEWLLWVLGRIAPGNTPTPAKLARVMKAAEVWLATNVDPDLTQFRHYDADLFRHLANLRLRRDVVLRVLQEMQIKTTDAADILRLQTLETPQALRQQLAQPQPFAPLGNVAAPKVLSKPLTAAEISLAYELILGRAATLAEVKPILEGGSTSISQLRSILLSSIEFRTSLQKQDTCFNTLIHIHVPKTAGTTLNSILAEGLHPNSIMALHDANMGELLAKSMPDRRRLRLLRGHMLYGVASKLPQPAQYLTVLRKPGPRIYSFYQYVLRTAEHPLHEISLKKKMSFGDFLVFATTRNDLMFEMKNGQVRRLAGLGKSAEDQNDLAIFRRALQNIFAPDMLFGLTEHFDLFLTQLAEAGIIKAPKVRELNVAPPGQSYETAMQSLSQQEAQIFSDFTCWDDRFYAICKSYVLGLNLE